MLNFHKYGFLDSKKIQRYIIGNDYWLETLNPNWIFVWSDTYKPEVAYDDSFAYIRLFIPEVGMTYYPPLGNGDLKRAIRLIREDAKENDFDFNMTSFDQQLFYKVKDFQLDLKENTEWNSHIYTVDDIAFIKKRVLSKQFEKEHKNVLYRDIKKEDFPQILEFIERWSRESELKMDKAYFDQLNSIKKTMEHLYEFDFTGIILYDEDQIYGLAIGSIMENMTFVHLMIALKSVSGALEELCICYCKRVSTQTRYINFGKNSFEFATPFKIEKCYSTYRL